MLAKYWRLHLKNSTGQTLTYAEGARIAVRMSPWKMVNGVLTYGTTITDDMGFGTGETIANAAVVEGTVQDNTTNVYWGINGFLSVLHDVAAADGYVYLYIEESDDNTNWASDCTIFNVDLHAKLIGTLDLDNTDVDQSHGVNFWWGG